MFSNNHLYHVSEDANIGVFTPRDGKVWTINKEHLHNYLLPRQCPRVCYWANENCAPNDADLLNGFDHVICVERTWKEAIETKTLFVYAFTKSDFSVEDHNAGYFVCALPQVPVNRYKLSNLHVSIKECGADLRYVDNLFQIENSVKNSSLNFSMIRMRNAKQTTSQSTPT